MTPERIAAALALANHLDRNMGDGVLNEWTRAQKLVHAYRATAPKLRTRAEVDAEIARLIREAFVGLHPETLPEWSRGRIEVLRRLCAEPTTPTDSGPSSESDRPPPVAAAGAAFSPWKLEMHRGDDVPRILSDDGCECFIERGNVVVNTGRLPLVFINVHALKCLLVASGETIESFSGPRPTPATKESSDTAGVEAGAANRITDHDADQREVEACSCEESEALKDELKECRQLLDYARRCAQDIATVLEEARK